MPILVLMISAFLARWYRRMTRLPTGPRILLILSMVLLLDRTLFRLVSRLLVLVQNGAWLRTILMPVGLAMVGMEFPFLRTTLTIPVWVDTLAQLRKLTGPVSAPPKLLQIDRLMPRCPPRVLVWVWDPRLVTSLWNPVLLIPMFRLVVTLRANLTGKLQALRRANVLELEIIGLVAPPVPPMVMLRTLTLPLSA